MMNPKPHQKSLRLGRYGDEGLFYFLTTITKDRETFFLHPPSAKIVLNALKWLDQQGKITLVSAVVMPDHLHFIAQLKDTTLSKLMHSLKSYTANEINKALERKGPVWERQYYERGIRNEELLMEVVIYCLENPVRKGLVDDFRKYNHWYCMFEL
ncbi:MAG TPA: transposase [Thermodesulfobacteriota bacterium]|nr:transposase [Thermodesulfobacteriota bacterium]